MNHNLTLTEIAELLEETEETIRFCLEPFKQKFSESEISEKSNPKRTFEEIIIQKLNQSLEGKPNTYNFLEAIFIGELCGKERFDALFNAWASTREKPDTQKMLAYNEASLSLYLATEFREEYKPKSSDELLLFNEESLGLFIEAKYFRATPQLEA